jgi:hypothetical protein
MTFPECVSYCAKNQELVSNFDRLQGRNLSRKGSPIELMIDDSTGRFEADMKAFSEFVYEMVWTRLPLAQN